MSYASQIGSVPVPCEEAKEADRIVGALDRLCAKAESLNNYSSVKLSTVIRPTKDENCMVESVFCSANAPLFERMASLICKINMNLEDISRTLDKVEL